MKDPLGKQDGTGQRSSRWYRDWLGNWALGRVNENKTRKGDIPKNRMR